MSHLHARRAVGGTMVHLLPPATPSLPRTPSVRALCGLEPRGWHSAEPILALIGGRFLRGAPVEELRAVVDKVRCVGCHRKAGP